MKNMCKLFVFVCCLAMPLLSQAQADLFDLDTKASGPVTVCGNSITFTVKIAKTSSVAAQDIRLFPTLPTGMTYVTGSAVGMTEVLPVNPANPSFQIVDFSTAMITVSFQARAECSLIATLKATGDGNLINNKTKITYTAGGTPYTFDEINGSDSYSVLYAQLEMFLPENEKNIGAPFINKTINRHIRIKNTGLGPLTSFDFFFKGDTELALDKIEAVTNSGPVTLASNTNGPLGRKFVITDFTRFGDGDAFFEENEEIQLVDYVRATTSKGSIETIYTAEWGCGAVVCNLADKQSTFAAYIEAVGGRPQINYSFDVRRQSDLCNAEPAIVRYHGTNAGSGNLPATRDAAFDVYFQLSIYGTKTTDDIHFYAVSPDNTLTPLDPLVTYQEYDYNQEAFPKTNRIYYVRFGDKLTTDPDGAGGIDDVDGDGYYDDLPVNATLNIDGFQKYTFQTEILSYAGQNFHTQSSGFTYKTWDGILDGMTYGSRGDLVRVVDSDLNGLPDLVSGKLELYKLDVDLRWDPLTLENKNGLFEIVTTLPAGVTVKAARWNTTALPMTVSGNVVRIRYPFFQMPSNLPIEFDFELNCAMATGGSNIVRTEMYYYSDPACPNARFKLVDRQKEVILHCGGCSTTETTRFGIERKTLGWVRPTKYYYTYGELYGPGATAQRVTRTTPGIRLDAAYPRDEVEVVLQGRVAAASNNLSAEIKYASPLDLEALHFSNGTFIVNGNTYTFPAGYQPQKTVNERNYTYNFTIPLAAPGWPANLTAGTVFEARLIFRIDDLEDVVKGEYFIPEIRGRFFSVINGTPSGCAGFGGQFSLMRPLFNQKLSTSIGYNYDETKKVLLASIMGYWTNPADIFVPDFPNEFRPLNLFDNLTLTLPKGFVFDRTKPIHFNIDFYSNVNAPFNDAVFSADNRTVTIPLTANTAVGDRAVTVTAAANIDCENPDNLYVPSTLPYDARTYESTFTYNIYPYLPPSGHVPDVIEDIDVTMYNKRRPDLRLTANSIQEGYSENVRWPIQLCNPYSNFFLANKSLNTWAAFELQSNDHSTILQRVVDAEGNALETIFYGPKDSAHPNGRYMLVKLGDLDVSSCIELEVIGTYMNCQEDVLQNINVYASWDYYNYPELRNYTGSIVDRKASCEGNLCSETMAIKYKTADLQWEVRKNGPEQVDLCVATPFEIDLASTKYGDIRQLKVWYELPPGVTLDQASAMYFYPYESQATPIPQEAFINENGKPAIDVAVILGGNLPGVRLPDNKIKLALNIITSCGFDPGLPITYSVTGLTNCGEEISYSDQRKIKLVGFTPEELGDVTLVLSGPQSLSCNSLNDVALTITNNATVLSRASKLEITLPQGTTFSEMVSTDLPAPAIRTVGGKTILKWNLPAGYLAAGETRGLTLRSFLSQTPAGTTAVMFRARIFDTRDALCTETSEGCATEITVGVNELTIPVTGLASLSISHQKVVCAYQFKAGIAPNLQCTLNSFVWNFGDGATSTERTPLHSFAQPGTYTVSVNVSFNCGGCAGTQFKEKIVVISPSDAEYVDVLLEIPTDTKEDVLNLSVSTYSDAWPSQHLTKELQEKHSLLNGTEGVWRNDGIYAYREPRKASPDVNLEHDGTFSAYNFNWQYADVDAVPGWTRVTAMTQYSPYSYELENRDVTGVYSASLFDYGGHLPSAAGENMRNAEMGFTSFEYIDGRVTGNFIFGTEEIPNYYLYNVNTARGNAAVVEASMKELEDVKMVDVSGRGVTGSILHYVRTRYIQNDEIICMKPYGPNPDWTIVVLKEAIATGYWKGRIKVKNDIKPVVTPDIDITKGHSGFSSLKVTSEKVFAQHIIQPEKNKSYVVSAWVTVPYTSVIVPTLAENLGIDVVIRNKLGQVTGTFPIVPQGSIIEGWQQVRGTFTYTGESDSYFELKFKPGSTGTAWYDDLRFHPSEGNMKTFVYDMTDYRLRAILDEENFASFYFYDLEGNLHLVKKESEKGVITVSENVSNLKEQR